FTGKSAPVMLPACTVCADAPDAKVIDKTDTAAQKAKNLINAPCCTLRAADDIGATARWILAMPRPRTTWKVAEIPPPRPVECPFA
ncbi:hypothetical protein, partial [Caballeronia sp. M23-90]